MDFPEPAPGTVFWITGLSGAGKTTLAHALVPALRARGRAAVLLAAQGIDAVCATISMFDAVRDWNRANNRHYAEIYLDVALAERVRRDPKGIYARAKAGTEDGVPGFDEEFEAPKFPDIVFGPDPLPEPALCVAQILGWLDRRA
jgi:cytidine diphosphoramidate kinase